MKLGLLVLVAVTSFELISVLPGSSLLSPPAASAPPVSLVTAPSAGTSDASSVTTPGLSIPLTVKEVAGVGASGYPISTVIPLPFGQFQTVASLRVVDTAGAPVPAQIDVLNRWWGKDNSIRHVKIEFQPTVGPHGDRSYTLRDSGAGPVPPSPVVATDTGAHIKLSSGSQTFTIQKSPFRIMTPAGDIVATVGDLNGRSQLSFSRSDAVITIEESGPMRAVVRAEAVTRYAGPAGHVHGWAVRVYAYAGQPFLKVDYQLQNSSKDRVYAAPFYFTSLSLSRPGPVPVSMRYMAELQGMVTPSTIDLIPLSPTAFAKGLYWLDDMRHVLFETMYWFGGTAHAATFQFPPVATVPTSWYARTRATLDLGGIVPAVAASVKTNRRQPSAVDAAHRGWDNFYVDVDRKLAPSMAGGWAYSGSRWIATEDPADVYEAERFALGELNVRPQWMAQYQHDRDWPILKLSSNPYAGPSWRRYEPSAPPTPWPNRSWTLHI